MNEPIVLRVVGVPQTQGNKSAFVVQKKGEKPRAVVREGRSEAAHKRHKDWRQAVADAARAWQIEHGSGLLVGPLVVRSAFLLPRPASAPKTRRTWPVVRPDVEKLQRSVLDSLKGTIIVDDAKVVLSIESKDYGDPPGVEIRIWQVPEGTTAIVPAFTFIGAQELVAP